MRVSLLAALLLLALGCDDSFGTARLGDESFELVDARTVIESDAGQTVIRLNAWDDPACSIFDDETGFAVDLVIPDLGAVPVGVDIEVGPNAPFEARISMSCFCEYDPEPPAFSLSGTVRFDQLSTDSAAGGLALELVGDVPGYQGTFASDTELAIHWDDFAVPNRIDHCD